jgi:hypothetical protein
MALAALNTAAVLELEGRAVESEQRYIQVLDSIKAEVISILSAYVYTVYTYTSTTCTQRCLLQEVICKVVS